MENDMEKERDDDTSNLPPVSTVTQQSWGAVLAIVIILAMIILGAIYAWNKRVSYIKSISISQPASAITATSSNSK